MLQPTLITWVLIVFGVVLIFLPMLYAQLLLCLYTPHQRTWCAVAIWCVSWRWLWW